MIFTRVNFLNEGEQAEEYKKRKAEEAAKKEKEEKETVDRRFNRMDMDSRSYAADVQFRDVNRRVNTFKKDIANAAQRKLSNDEEEKSLRNAENVRNAGITSKDLKHFYPVNDNDEYRHKQKIDIDGISKDMRRHPERWKEGPDGQLHREFSIFENVEFI